MFNIVDFVLLERIAVKSNQENGAPYGHAMEELAELQVECSHVARGIGDPEKLKEESADVLFKILRIADFNGWELNDLIEFCLKKTREKFPHQLEIK